MNIRKSVNSLTVQERERYVAALLKFKYTPSPISGRTYDSYVRWHQESWFYNAVAISTHPDEIPFYSYAHGCSAFLPWHREYLRLLELDLQAISGDTELSIPYWDWADDATLDDPTEAPIWNDGFMGGNGDESQDRRVTTGPFSYREGRWPLHVRTPHNPNGGDLEPDLDLRRNLGAHPAGHLPTVDEVRAVLNIKTFDSPPFNGGRNPSDFRGLHERTLHNLPHMWVGYSMMSGTSPNDPSFFLHHANVDRIWAKWQSLNPEVPYVPNKPVDIPGLSLDEMMEPFGKLIRDVLDCHSMGYEYDGKATDDTAPDDTAPAPAPEAFARMVGSLQLDGPVNSPELNKTPHRYTPYE